MIGYLNDYWMGGGVVPKAKAMEGRRREGSSYRIQVKDGCNGIWRREERLRQRGFI